VEVLAYVASSLAIIWSFGGGQISAVFWTRVMITGPLCLIMAFFLLRSRREVQSLKPNAGSWMMGIGIGLVMFLVGLVLAWIFKDKKVQLLELSNYRILGLAFWVLFLSPACEIIYRKVLGPSWGTKSSAFVEALNFGVAAVNFYLFCLVFIWGYIGSRVSMRFGIVAAIIARSVATLLLILCLKAVV